MFQSILSEVINDLLPQTQIDDINETEIIDANGTIIEDFNWAHFYKYIAYEGLHLSSSFQSNINSNPVELTKYHLYNDKASRTAKDCQ